MWHHAPSLTLPFRPIILVSGCHRTSVQDIIKAVQDPESPWVESHAQPSQDGSHTKPHQPSSQRTRPLSHPSSHKRARVSASLATCAQRIERMPWVSRVTLVRLWPWYLLIQVQEKKAVAIWQHRGVQQLIAHDGSVIQGINPASFASLPIVAGDKCCENLSILLGHLTAVRHFLSLKGATYLRCGSWVLYHGKKGGRILLPANQIPAALHTLRHYWKTIQDAEVIDLRSPHALIYTGVP